MTRMTRIWFFYLPDFYGVRWQSESASGDTALASASGSMWSAVAERVGERRHRFGFGIFELLTSNSELPTPNCAATTNHTNDTNQAFPRSDLYGVRWQSESASGDTALASGP